MKTTYALTFLPLLFSEALAGCSRIANEEGDTLTEVTGCTWDAALSWCNFPGYEAAIQPRQQGAVIDINDTRDISFKLMTQTEVGTSDTFYFLCTGGTEQEFVIFDSPAQMLSIARVVA
ncbi:hypothetical protein BFW01_g366 [Lasiodiplodia theobromae]|uniref:Uncharacterized protein n=1 Tax=Lasiodiplodia theobromae TaxID=45133 RepID=A0A5N5CYB7_9PEZI|nr:Serine hydroxymethyltransferase [Lasiodiplodia theobromae]KAB2570358.1 hypothetical protein DBV05_g10976 [Lasiodiplodia theobromae]KAF4539566.1 Serine hydroxymethyltransferase [Lasiodiplodia theobromae]KAF9630185.1 hypothetical protein BFW01_g366 [Lasiodiplodia theobromae]